MTSTITSLLTAVAALGAVFGLIWLAQSVARRVGPSRFLGGGTTMGTARLAMVQSLALDQRRRLQLVRCDGQHFLLLTGGTHDVVLGLLARTDST